MSGFTKSYRQKWQHPIFRDLLEAGIWAWMCDTAAWKDTTIRFNGEAVKLARGQLVTSVRFISQGFRVGEQVTRTFLENLEKDGMANTLPTHRGTIITICNYDKYQQNENADNTLPNEQLTNSQHTANTNKKEYKKERKKESMAKPDSVSESVWCDFLELRKKKNAPVTHTVVNGIEKEASKASLTLEAALAECCVRGWQSFKADWYNKPSQFEKPKPQRAGVKTL